MVDKALIKVRYVGIRIIVVYAAVKYELVGIDSINTLVKGLAVLPSKFLFHTPFRGLEIGVYYLRVNLYVTPGAYTLKFHNAAVRLIGRCG